MNQIAVIQKNKYLKCKKTRREEHFSKNQNKIGVAEEAATSIENQLPAQQETKHSLPNTDPDLPPFSNWKAMKLKHATTKRKKTTQVDHTRSAISFLRSAFKN